MMKLSLMSSVVKTIQEDRTSYIANNLAEKFFNSITSIKYLRASANFIFLVVVDNNDYVLRFNTLEERSIEQVQEEISVLNYLHNNNYPVCEIVNSLNKMNYEIVEIDNVKYIATMFKKVAGEIYEIEDLPNNQYAIWGKKLAQLHNILEECELSINERSYINKLEFIAKYLSKDEEELLLELNYVKEQLANLPKDKSNFGIIHFDFELDNLLFSEVVSVIDFDDLITFWHAADIIYATRDIFSNKQFDNQNDNFKLFIAGYKEERSLSDDDLSNIPLFIRFHRLLFIARIRKSLDITDFSNHPEWVKKLSIKLQEKYVDEQIEDIKNNIVKVR